MPGSDSLWVGSERGSRRSLAQWGLSSSVGDCPDIPRPLRRRVLDGCTSQGFTASVAFAVFSPARLPLGLGSLRGYL